MTKRSFTGRRSPSLARAGAARPSLVINTTNITTCTPLQFTAGAVRPHRFRPGPLSAVARRGRVALPCPCSSRPSSSGTSPTGCLRAEAIVIQPAADGDIFASYRNVLADANRRYRDVARYPYVYLMDGGLSDNLSLRNLLNQVTLSGGWDAVLGRLRSRGVTRLAIIVVNAAVEGEQPWERLDEAPPLKSIVSAISNASINRANRETMAMVEMSLSLWRRERAAVRADRVRAPEVYLVRIEFRLSADPADRAFFDTVPTRFHLPAETVDRVVAAGGRLLAESPEFRRLLADLAAERLGGAAQPPIVTTH